MLKFPLVNCARVELNDSEKDSSKQAILILFFDFISTNIKWFLNLANIFCKIFYKNSAQSLNLIPLTTPWVFSWLVPFKFSAVIKYDKQSFDVSKQQKYRTKGYSWPHLSGRLLRLLTGEERGDWNWYIKSSTRWI